MMRVHGVRRKRAGLISAAAMLAAVLPAAAGQMPMQVSMMRGASACVALTFDDGPDVTLTPKLLSILESKNAVATFFVVGYRAQTWPDPVIRANMDGDEVGNHSWDHPALPSLSSPAALSELTRTDDVITKLIGHPPAVSRAPYGSMSERVAALSPRTFVAWSVDTLDWEYPDADRITRVALADATNGAIILMHDIHPRTIDAVPGIIDGLRQRGYTLVTASQLLSGQCGGTPVAFGAPGGEGPAPAAPSAPVTASAGAKTQASAQNAKGTAATAIPAPAATRQPYTLFADE
jgi:peptidoglycan/xylan/chitin deacetylase (PgdA/CDA1 family)